MSQDPNHSGAAQSSDWQQAKDGQDGTSGDSMWTILSRELQDRVIESLEHPQDVVAFWGYRFSGPKVTFLYLDLQFNDYLAISHEELQGEKPAYIHHIDLATPLCPMAGSIVWVRAGAILRHVRSHTSTERAEKAADMLKGSIQGLYGPNMPSLPLTGTESAHKMKSTYAMMGTGNNTPGCPYRPPTSDCPTSNNCQPDG